MKTQIINLIRLIQNVFKQTANFNVDFEDFYNKFLASSFAEEIFNNFDSYYYHPFNIVYEFLEEEKIKEIGLEYNENFIDYVGFIVSKFYEKTNENPAKILKYLPFSYLKNNFEYFHIINEEEVISKSIIDFNLKNNILRKQRSSENVSISKYNEIKKLVFARYIFSKLILNSSVASAEIKYSNFLYFGNDKTFFVVTDKIEEIDIYDEYKFQKENKILAIFLDRISEQNDEITIENVRKKYFGKYPFTYIMLIRNRYIYLIDNSEVYKLFYVYSKVDENKVNNLAKLLFQN